MTNINKTVAMVSFWVFAAAMILSYLLTVLVFAIPPTNQAAAEMMLLFAALLGLSGSFSLVVLLYSLASMLGAFDDASSSKQSDVA